MASLNSILSGSLVFRDKGLFLSEIKPGTNAVTITGSLNVTGSRITLNGSDLVERITTLESGQGADQVKFGAITIWTSSINDWSASVKDNINTLNSTSEALNLYTGSSQSEIDSLSVESIAQASRLALLEVSGSDKESRLSFLESKPIVSSSTQISQFGFLTASIGGIISSSLQISRLGYITGSKFTELDDIPPNIISSSIQVVNNLYNKDLDLGTGHISASGGYFTDSLDLVFDGVTNYFNINVDGEDKIKVNEEGILQLFAQTETPTPVEGGIFFGEDDNLYLGVND